MAAACSVDDCEKGAATLGLCPMHYQRQRLTGSVGSAEPMRLRHKGAACAFAGCEGPRRRQEWCAQHYNQWRRTGRVWPIKRREIARPCLVCGAAPGGGYRQFCGQACSLAWRAHPGGRPAVTRCVLCNAAISLGGRKNGRLIRVDTRICPGCRISYRKHALSPQQLVNRDGPACGICGDEVDMSLRRPNLYSASVDHIIPRALGGSNDPENLQLAHLYCNQLKSDLRGKVPA